MRCAVTGFIGTGAPRDPFMPDITQDVLDGGGWAIRDLRPDETSPAGVCLFFVRDTPARGLQRQDGSPLTMVDPMMPMSRVVADEMAASVGLRGDTPTSVEEVVQRVTGDSSPLAVLKDYVTTDRAKAAGLSAQRAEVDQRRSQARSRKRSADTDRRR